ncbi:MAG: putative replication factor A subunit protein RFA1, partial [Streblomastix strix]
VSEQISKKQLGQTFAKRSIIVVDESEYQIELTLWRESAVQFNGNVGDVIVAVNAKIAEFNGFRSATVSNQTNLEINPKDISRVSELQKWFRKIQSEEKEKIEHNLWKKIEATGGKSGTDGKEQKVAHSVSTQQLKQTDVDQLDKGAEFFNVIGAITYFKRTNLWYLACPNTKCSRKIQEGDQSCKSCGHNLIADGPGVKRYILSLLLSDSEGSIWVNVFNEMAVVMLKQTADNLSVFLAQNAENRVDEAFQPVLFATKQFRIRAKKNTFSPNQASSLSQDISGEQRSSINYSIVNILKPDFAQESHVLLEKIQYYGYDI